MKAPLVLAAILASATALHSETTMETAPLSGNDIASLLELHVEKSKISFDAEKTVLLRWESGGSSKEIALMGTSKSVSLMTYIPSGEGPMKQLNFWITGSGNSVSSYFAFDSSKTKFRRTEIIDGIFTITAYQTEDFSGPFEYRIQVIGKNP